MSRIMPLDPALPKAGRTKMPKAIPLTVRREVAERSGGICECGCGRQAAHTHHRKLRRQGGRHEPINLLHLSTECHQRAHANPLIAYRLGYLVRSTDDPAAVPIQPWSDQ